MVLKRFNNKAIQSNLWFNIPCSKYEKGGGIVEECDYKCKSCQDSCLTKASTENLLAMGINCSRYSGLTNEYAEMQEAIELELNTRDDA